MYIIEEYKRHTGSEIDGGKCASCENAIWRILRPDAPETYDAGKNCSIACHCVAIGNPITHIIYACSAHTVSAETQRAEFADL